MRMPKKLVYYILLTLAGCSPADDAVKVEEAREYPQDEFRAYCDAFNATGASFWIVHPEQVLVRPEEALKSLVAAKEIKVDPDKIHAASRLGPYVCMERQTKVGKLIEIARFAMSGEAAKANEAIEKYRKYAKGSWPNCWRKE